MRHRPRKGSAAAASRRSAYPDGRKAPDGNRDPTAAGIAALAGRGIDELRDAWLQRFGCPAPQIQSADILRRLLAWKLQAETFGDFDAETIVALRRARVAVAKGRSPCPHSTGSMLRAGTVLVREWRGITHRVFVLDTGFEHQGKRFGSLSEVARAISGTRWSGPRFFGLQERPSSEPKGASPEEAGP